jgi:3-oxoadipate enol-lactonase/4-carboxymuconolactone decarboxylase
MPMIATSRTELHYRLDGPASAPVIALATSLGASIALWDPIVPELAQHLRVLRFDYRGHGSSPPVPGPYTIADLGGDVIALLDGLGIARASVCGISLGGQVALWLAAHAPERVDRLVAACTAAQFGTPAMYHERAQQVLANGVEPLLEGFVARWFTPRFAAARPDEVARILGLVAAVTREGYAGCCEAVGHADLRADLARIAAPTLVLAARHDATAPLAASLAIAEGIRDATVTVLPDAAHLACVEQPRRFAAAVLEHVIGPAYERGRAVQQAVLGPAQVDAIAAATAPATVDFHDFVARYAWGEIWSRPGLDRRTRSAIAIATRVAQGRLDELALHLRGGIRNGLSAAEISEILLQSAVDCGVPAATAAFAIAQRVLEEPAGAATRGS